MADWFGEWVPNYLVPVSEQNIKEDDDLYNILDEIIEDI